MFDLNDVPWMVPLVVGLTEVVKQFKVRKRWIPVAAVVVGIGLSLTYEATVQLPWIAPWLVATIKGAIAGLTSVGLYLVSKKFRPAGAETPQFTPPEPFRRRS